MNSLTSQTGKWVRRFTQGLHLVGGRDRTKHRWLGFLPTVIHSMYLPLPSLSAALHRVTHLAQDSTFIIVVPLT